MRKVLLAATASLSFFAVTAAHAQSNPSAQQLINQLKPSGTVSDTTRGIKPLAPSTTESTGGMAAPATPAVASSAPEAPAAAPSANLEVDFASGSANLTPRAEASLDQLGKALTSTQLASYNFKIVGHTDTAGNADTNQTLSEQRAEAVKSYLETKFGVADSRLQAQGVGESDLAVQTPANTPNARNRRVEVINLGQ
jgi:OmpA-OmpF porin, OOP family